MRLAHVTLKSTAPYSQSRMHDTPKKEKERADDYEQRTWRNRLHVDENGEVYIPPMALKNSLGEAAKFLAMPIVGKGKATYTKHFDAGVLVVDGVPLGIKAEDVKGERLYLNADGRTGGNKRVWRTYPRIPEWSGKVTYYVLDETITRDVFEKVLREAGRFIGIGRFRPRNRGFYGRYETASILWEEEN